MRLALLAVAAVWLLGCLWSFHEQTAFAAAKGFNYPHLLPLVIDGFAIAMAGVSWAASLDARTALATRVATLVAVAGSAASNGAWAWFRTGHDTAAVVLAVAVPVAANLAFEVLLAEVRRQVQRRRGLPAPVAIPYPRLVRIALAPVRTVKEWRELVLELTAPPPSSPAGRTTTRRCADYVLRRLIVDRATVAAVARELGRSWDTVNSTAVEATRTLLLSDTTRLDGVAVIGVDEHRWAHTRHAAGDGYVTVIVDLTPVVAGTGRARLFDLVPGRSAAAPNNWLADRDQAFRDRVEVVAMDGFGGYENAATTALPDAVTVMDPFHVVALAGTKIDLCRQRVQQDTRGHRGRSCDPLYRVRRTLRTRTELSPPTSALS